MFSKVCWQCPAMFCLYTPNTEGEGDGIESRLPFKTFSTLRTLISNLKFLESTDWVPNAQIKVEQCRTYEIAHHCFDQSQFQIHCCINQHICVKNKIFYYFFNCIWTFFLRYENRLRSTLDQLAILLELSIFQTLNELWYTFGTLDKSI